MGFLNRLVSDLSGDTARRLDLANGVVGQQIAELARLSRENAALRKQLADLMTVDGFTPEAVAPWTVEELKLLRHFEQSALGVKYAAQMRALAAAHREALDRCAHGTEARNAGYAHGFSEAAELLPRLSARLEATIEQTHAEAAASDASRDS